jgi:putative transposase
MFEDEAGFGRINKPKSCWCPKGVRPSVPCHHIREYRYAYGAVEPATGESFFLTGFSKCNNANMEFYLSQLSENFSDDLIVLACDKAAWHTSKNLSIPTNIVVVHIPPYTPEMNPIEQIWKELRARGFKNEIFATLDKVHDRLDETIKNLSLKTIKSITGRDWIISIC